MAKAELHYLDFTARRRRQTERTQQMPSETPHDQGDDEVPVYSGARAGRAEQLKGRNIVSNVIVARRSWDVVRQRDRDTNRSPVDRSEAARKGWETRRHRAIAAEHEANLDRLVEHQNYFKDFYLAMRECTGRDARLELATSYSMRISSAGMLLRIINMPHEASRLLTFAAEGITRAAKNMPRTYRRDIVDLAHYDWQKECNLAPDKKNSEQLEWFCNVGGPNFMNQAKRVNILTDHWMQHWSIIEFKCDRSNMPNEFASRKKAAIELEATRKHMIDFLDYALSQKQITVRLAALNVLAGEWFDQWGNMRKSDPFHGRNLEERLALVKMQSPRNTQSDAERCVLAKVRIKITKELRRYRLNLRKDIADEAVAHAKAQQEIQDERKRLRKMRRDIAKVVPGSLLAIAFEGEPKFTQGQIRLLAESIVERQIKIDDYRTALTSLAKLSRAHCPSPLNLP